MRWSAGGLRIHLDPSSTTSSSPYEINLNSHRIVMDSFQRRISFLLFLHVCASKPDSPVIAPILIKISHQPCMAGALFRSKVFLTPWAKKTWAERFYGCFRDCAQQVVARVSSKYWRWEWQIAISSDTPRALHPLNVLSTQIVIPDNFLSRPPSCFNLPFVQFFTPLFSSSGNILMSLGSLKIRKCLPFLPSTVEEDCDLYRALPSAIWSPTLLACFVNFPPVSHLLFSHVFLHLHFYIFISHHKGFLRFGFGPPLLRLYTFGWWWWTIDGLSVVNSKGLNLKRSNSFLIKLIFWLAGITIHLPPKR